MPGVVLSSHVDLHQAQDLFLSSARAIPHELFDTEIGYNPATFSAPVFWFSSLGIWAYFGLPPKDKSEGKRFWNAFGVGRPARTVDITCEVNPSRDGINRRTKGAFIRMQNGRTIICHRGAFNIHGGMTAKFFRERFQGDWLDATEGINEICFAKVAELGSSSFGGSLKHFVSEVRRIKDLARAD